MLFHQLLNVEVESSNGLAMDLGDLLLQVTGAEFTDKVVKEIAQNLVVDRLSSVQRIAVGMLVDPEAPVLPPVHPHRPGVFLLDRRVPLNQDVQTLAFQKPFLFLSFSPELAENVEVEKSRGYEEVDAHTWLFNVDIIFLESEGLLLGQDGPLGNTNGDECTCLLLFKVPVEPLEKDGLNLVYLNL